MHNSLATQLTRRSRDALVLPDFDDDVTGVANASAPAIN
jgi:hypothetical protein